MYSKYIEICVSYTMKTRSTTLAGCKSSLTKPLSFHEVSWSVLIVAVYEKDIKLTKLDAIYFYIMKKYPP